MTEEIVTKLPDEFYAAENYAFSYRFADKNGQPIPNEFGYRVMKYIKTTCVQNGRAVIAHSDVRPVLAEYERDVLAGLLNLHGEPWVPIVLKKGKAVDMETA